MERKKEWPLSALESIYFILFHVILITKPEYIVALTWSVWGHK